MWAALQFPTPEDYVFATGQQYSIRNFVEEAFGLCGYDIQWRGSGTNEVGFDKTSGKILIEIDPLHYRPVDIDALLGNPDKAKKQLNWYAKTSFKELVSLMVESDLKGNGIDSKKYISKP
jgi:GDPmannose 4,6-dehydratase